MTRNSEIARKFYASMRNTSQCPNSSSVESHNDVSATSDTASSSIDRDRPTTSKEHRGHIRIFRTPQFFKSIPIQS